MPWSPEAGYEATARTQQHHGTQDGWNAAGHWLTAHVFPANAPNRETAVAVSAPVLYALTRTRRDRIMPGAAPGIPEALNVLRDPPRR